MIKRFCSDSSGQAVVEAAFVLPVIMILMLMLVQPAIVLYDRTVMNAAAAEGCRLLATARSDEASACEAYILRRLGSVPQQDLFHVHEPSCAWEIDLIGDSSSAEVTIRIANEIELLPIVGAGAAALGAADGEGRMRVEVEATLPTQPSWVSEAEVGYESAEWVGAWVD